jgi:serine phosphatase RsbU (regulator of sigma subunit)
VTVLADVEQAIRTAPPHGLVQAARAALTAGYGVSSVRVYLADYGLTVLRPVDSPPHTGGPLSLHNSAQGRVFGSQEPNRRELPQEGSVEHHLPVTCRGERLGVMSVVLPRERSVRGAAEDLVRIADLLGHEILVAERDTDLYRLVRRTSRLTLAAEMQWELLPGRACEAAEYALGAHLEPAYAIHGDNFDWSADQDTLTLAVTNGMGEGIQASLLTNLAVKALRNARRAGIGVADQAALADQALYEQHRGARYVSTLLLRFDLASGVVEAVDAGSPQLWRQRGKTVERVDLDAQLPLGMFDESDYVAQKFQVVPGDRLLFASDGVYEALSPRGETYGERALARAISSTSLLPAAMAPRAVLSELAGFRETETLDDALVVCLDWFGRPGAAVG